MDIVGYWFKDVKKLPGTNESALDLQPQKLKVPALGWHVGSCISIHYNYVEAWRLFFTFKRIVPTCDTPKSYMMTITSNDPNLWKKTWPHPWNLQWTIHACSDSADPIMVGSGKRPGVKFWGPRCGLDTRPHDINGISIIFSLPYTPESKSGLSNDRLGIWRHDSVLGIWRPY